MELPLITVTRIHADAAMLAGSYQRALAAACSNTLFFFFLCVFYSILVSVLMLYKFKVYTLPVAARAVYECSKCQECRPVTLDSAPSIWPGLGFTGS